MKLFQLKASALTVLFMLTFVSLTNQSCGVKLPTSVQDTISTLSTTLPGLMGKASGAFTPELSKQADSILASITTAANLTKGGKTSKVSDLLTSLGSTKLKPFLDMWKSKGKLDQNTIDAAIKGVNTALAAIKKAGRLK